MTEKHQTLPRMTTHHLRSETTSLSTRAFRLVHFVCVHVHVQYIRNIYMYNKYLYMYMIYMYTIYMYTCTCMSFACSLHWYICMCMYMYSTYISRDLNFVEQSL